MALPADEDEVDTSQPASNGSSTVLPGGIITPQGSTDPNALLRQAIPTLLQQISASSTQPVSLPSLRRSPDDGTRPGWLGLLGEALAGGQSPLYRLSGQQEDLAGSRALMNFGINMMLASGPNRVRPSLFSAAAAGLQGAQESMDRSQQQAYTQAGQQFEQQKALADLQMQQQQNRIKTLQAYLPLLTLQARTNLPSLYGNNQPPGPGTAAQPAVPPGNYGAGGAGADIKVPAAYMPYFQEASARTGIPVDVLIAQARQESGFNANATGSAGEIGIGQIKPSTAKEPGFGLAPVDPDKLKDPRTNINFQADYLKAHLPPGADPSDPAALRVALQGYNGGGDPKYVQNVTRYLPAPAPAAPAAPVQPPGRVQVAGPPSAVTQPPAATGAAALPQTGGVWDVGQSPAQMALDAAAAEAKRTGQPAPIQGLPGVAANADGSTVLRPAELPKPPTARTVTPGVVPAPPVAPGPAPPAAPLASLAPPGAIPPPAPTVTPPAGPTAQPGTPQPTPTPAPAVTTPAAPTPQSRNPDGSYVIPDEKLPSVLDYQARYRHAITPAEIQQRGMVLPDNPQALADRYTNVQEAERTAAAARAQADSVRSLGIGGTDASRAIQAENDANAKAAAARNAYDTLIQGANEKNAAALQTYYKDQDTQLASAYKDILDRQQQTALKTQEGKQAIQLEEAKARLGPEQKEIEDLNQSYTAARNAVDQLELARSLSRTAGDPGFFQYIQQNHPETAQWLANMGFPSQDAVQKAGETNAMDAAFNRLITMARFGTGFTRPTNLDVTILSSQAPKDMDPQAWREAKLAYMQSYMARQLDYVSKVRALQSQGVGLYDAEERAGREARPIVPQMDVATAADPAKRTAWAADLAPNTFFRDPNGRLHIWPPPPSSQTQTAPQQTTPYATTAIPQ